MVEPKTDSDTNLIAALRMVSKGRAKRLVYLGKKVKINSIKTTALLRSAIILRCVLENWKGLLLLKFY